MAINKLQYADRVVRLAAQRGIELDEANVESSLPIALLRLQRQIGDSPWRGHLEKTSGALTLTAGACTPALTDLPYASIKDAVHSDGTRISVLPAGTTKRDLLYPRNTYSYFAAISDDVFYVYDGNGAVAPNGTVILTYIAIPTLALVTDQLVPDLIEAGLAVAQR